MGEKRITCRSVKHRPADTVALIHRLLSWTFGVVGVVFLLAPNGTVRFLNAVGAMFGVFSPAPESELRFWLSLAFAYMVVVTALAARIASDPVAHRGLMPILAAGKTASSITCLGFFVLDRPAFLYFLNFLVDGSIALLVLGCAAWLAAADQASRRGAGPEGRTAELLNLLTEAMVPEGGPFATGARPLALDQAVWRYFAGLHTFGTVALAVILRGIEVGPYFFGPRRKRFSALSPAEREIHLAGWEASRIALRRQILNGLKLAIMLHFYDSPEACAEIGYDESYLRQKLLAGPNAAAHRARLA